MSKCPAFTTEYGFRSKALPVIWQYKPKITNSWINNSSNTVYAYSNRPAPIKGDFSTPTNYYRKLAYLTSLNSVDGENSSYSFRGPSSIHSRGVTLNAMPNGSAYSSSTVNVSDWLVDDVITNCLEGLTDLQANLLEDLGQIANTHKQMVGLYNAIVKATAIFILSKGSSKATWRYLRKYTKKRWKDTGGGPVRDVAGGWLGFIYGISPLVSTLIGLSTDFRRNHTSRVSSTVENALNPAIFVGTNAQLKGVTSGKASERASCVMEVSIDVSADLQMKRSLGIELSVADLTATLWALTPYSFVVDWLIPIESFLRTRHMASGIKYQRGYVGKALTCDATCSIIDAFTGAGDSGLLPKARVQAMQYQRIAYNSFQPPAGLSFRLALNPNQIVNAVALLAVQR